METTVVYEQIGISQDVRDLDSRVLGEGHQKMGGPGLDDELPVHRLRDLDECAHPVHVARVERREHGLPLRPTGGFDAPWLDKCAGGVWPAIRRGSPPCLP